MTVTQLALAEVIFKQRLAEVVSKKRFRGSHSNKVESQCLALNEMETGHDT